jgi:cytochrome c biogenesis protein CcdA
MFRPLVKGIPPGEVPDRRPVLLLALGFTISATVLYSALGLAGAALPDDRRVWSIAGTVMVALFVVDLVRIRSPFALGPSWRRQTPQRHTYRYGERRAALLWGLDTGLVFTTYRVTSLSWAALAVTALGLVPWWAGVAYALGFTVPLLVAVLAVPAGADPRTEPLWLVNRMYRSCGMLRVPAFVLLATGAVGSALTAFG